MTSLLKKRIIPFVTVVILVFNIITVATPRQVSAKAFQEANTELSSFAKDKAGLTSSSTPAPFQEVLGKFIKAMLAFLGIIFLILVLFGGFLWMTAAGSEPQVKKAQQVIGRSIIGVVIIVLAYAITAFVFDIALRTTGITK